MVADKVPDFAAEYKIELHHLNFGVYIYISHNYYEINIVIYQFGTG